MKKELITVCIFVFIILFTAKSEEITNGFLFPEYQKGNVYFKNHTVVGSLLNYETVTKEMLFKQDDQVLALGLTQTIDSVVMAGRVFVNYEKCEFFEKVSIGNGDVYIQYISTLISVGKQAGFGGYSQVSNVKSIGRMSTTDGGETHQSGELSSNEKFKAKTHFSFWIKSEGKLIIISSQKQALKAFPNNKQKIQSYFIDHKINFESLDDVTGLLNFCFSSHN
jgi:hypothetical protein